ncbi:sporulation protein YqfD [Sporosarcina siberiensis]|uniref:Sporulation protein YqfD n=1 Tax=Sporosarcina siberiensis TaxID=1365606 RepID=A0ABW4SBA2_9BACL
MSLKLYNIRLHGPGNTMAMLTQLKSTGTKITGLIMIDGEANFRTNRKGVKQIRKYRRRYRLKASISELANDANAGAFFTSYRYLLVFLIPFIGSLFLWTVDIESEIPEVSERIEQKLVNASIVRFRPLFLVPDEGEMRRQLMLDDPSLSWVRFKRIGTNLTVIPMLSPASNIAVKATGPPSDLVARTGGVITRFELKSGERVAHMHGTVKKGDLLATGILEQGEKTTIVGADGAVYADYWLEYSFVIPTPFHFKIQGEEQVELTTTGPLKERFRTLNEVNSLKSLFSHFITLERHVAEIEEVLDLDQKTEQSLLIPIIKQKLLFEQSSSMIIKEDKVLHVSFDDDKVSGTILFLVNDNIALKRSISQGD